MVLQELSQSPSPILHEGHEHDDEEDDELRRLDEEDEDDEEHEPSCHTESEQPMVVV